MKFDDSHPDYFVNDEAESTAQQPADDPRTIRFSPNEGNAEKDDEPTTPPKMSLWRRILYWTVGVAVVVLGITIYFRYFNPHTTDAKMRCYVTSVEKRGLIFKTYEVDVVSEAATTDTVRLYSRDVSFSIDDDQLAQRLQAVQGSGRLVTLTYCTYSATVPWRGASNSVITDAELPDVPTTSPAPAPAN